MNINFDTADLRPVIDAAVETALARLEAERLRDEHGRILLTKREASEALGISPSTLDRLRREHGLPAVKIDGLVLFRPAALDAWAAEREGGE